jgi:DNA-binding transcriptional LysR family regulator
MLDHRMETFLTLCEEMNFTRTAQKLNITQPAVSQHIRFLETCYGVKLFRSYGKRLELTPQGRQLREYSLSSKADWDLIGQKLHEDQASQHFAFGATLTIGEFVMPGILDKLIRKDESTNFTMLVDNTENLLHKLQDGVIQFAFIEGHLDKTAFHTTLFSRAEFIPVCGSRHPFAHRKVDFEEIFTQRLIVREPGSGTRDVFEHTLWEHNHSIDHFPHRIEIGSLNVIKALVVQGLGITFIYKNAVEQELAKGSLKAIDIIGYDVLREFNFVCLKNSQFTSEHMEFLDFCINCLQETPALP